MSEAKSPIWNYVKFLSKDIRSAIDTLNGLTLLSDEDGEEIIAEALRYNFYRRDDLTEEEERACDQALDEYEDGDIS